ALFAGTIEHEVERGAGDALTPTGCAHGVPDVPAAVAQPLVQLAAEGDEADHLTVVRDPEVVARDVSVRQLRTGAAIELRLLHERLAGGAVGHRAQLEPGTVDVAAAELGDRGGPGVEEVNGRRGKSDCHPSIPSCERARP